MKKLFSMLLVACFLVTASPMLFACTPSEKPHEHTYQTTWSKNQTHHWYACDGADCDSVSSKSEHTFNWVIDKEASVSETGLKHEECECGAKRSENTVIEKLPTTGGNDDSSPTISPSKSLADYLTLQNVTISETVTISGELFGSPITLTSLIKINGEEWLEQSTSYGATTTVYFDGQVAYENGVETTDYLSPAVMGTIEILSMKEDDFTKRSDNEFFAQTLSLGMGYAYDDVTISIVDERISSLNYSIESEDFSTNYSYTFTDFGKTSIDGEDYKKPSAWISLFDWDNVSIKKTQVADVDGTLTPITLISEWKIDGEKWFSYQEQEAEDNEVTKSVTVKFDGINSYLDGSIVEDSEIDFYHCKYEGLLYDLISLENSFTKTEEAGATVYKANEISLYGVVAYEDVQVTVIEGKISKIVYTDIDGYSLNEVRYPLISTFTFANWGTTIIN